MRVIPVGYSNPAHRTLIDQLMHDENTLLVDVRYSKASAIPGWHSTSLVHRYQDRYVYLGRVLGNRNFKDSSKPIEIVDMEGGIIDLMSVLRDGYTVLLLCGCSQYGPSKEHPEGCHRRVICEALTAYSSEVEIVLPETIVSRDLMVAKFRDEREVLEDQLSGARLPSLADYWLLPEAQRNRIIATGGIR